MLIPKISQLDINKAENKLMQTNISFKSAVPNKLVTEISREASEAIANNTKGVMEASASIIDKLKVSRVVDRYGKMVFLPITKLKEQILDKISKINPEKGDCADELKAKLIASIEAGNFDLQAIYDDYYSLLTICNSLEEVSSTYPTMKFPKSPDTSYNSSEPVKVNSGGRVYNNSTIKYVLDGHKPQFFTRMIHEHTNELPLLRKYILEKYPNSFSGEEVDRILQAYDHVSLDNITPMTLDVIIGLKNPKTKEYITTEEIVGLFNTMSSYLKNQECKNILATFISLYQSKNFDATSDLVYAISSGRKSQFTDSIARLKDDVALNNFIKIIASGDIYPDQIKYSSEYLELYSMTKNLDLINDFKKIFTASEIKRIIKTIKSDKKVLEKSKEYKSHTLSKTIKADVADVRTIFEDLGISENEQIKKIIETFNTVEKMVSPVTYPRTFKNRFKDADFDKAIIPVLQQLYIEHVPLSLAIVQIGENDTAKAINMCRYNNETWSTPNSDMLRAITAATQFHSDLTLLSKELEDFTDEEIKAVARTNATKNYWRDFHNYTRAKWMPVRLIKDRHHNPNSLYTLENLKTAYLYNLFCEFKKSGKKLEDVSPNPLAFVDSSEHLSKGLKGIIDSSYLTIFNAKKDCFDLYFSYGKFEPLLRYGETAQDYKEFNEFCKQINSEALMSSIEKLEKLYRKRFYRIYHFTNDRYKVLEADMKKAIENILERKGYYKGQKPATLEVSKEDNIELLNSVGEEFNPISDELIARMAYIVQQIKNPELKSRCQMCLNNNSIDKEYFDFVSEILEKSVITNAEGVDLLFEEKALVLFELYDKYLTTCEEHISSEEFVDNELKDYKLPNGDYDYKLYYANKEAELRFYSNMSKLEYLNEDEVLEFVFAEIEKVPFSELNQVVEDFISASDLAKDLITSKLKKAPDALGKKEIETLSDLTAIIKRYEASYWDLEKPEVVVLNDAGVNKRVIITSEAKSAILEDLNGNTVSYEKEILRYIKAADRYASESKSSGIKTVRKDGTSEIKVYGKSGIGSKRLYSVPITSSDIEKYKDVGDETMPIKYIFGKYDDHL